MTLPTPVPDRRFDLDWLRICAFGLLIFYHVGMFYVTWGWHVKSSHASPTVEPLMLLLNPWRLTLLFIISGCATRFMLDKMKPGRFLASRTTRLLIPLIFGMFVIVPPQTYFELVERLGYTGSYAEFYPQYATHTGGWPLAAPTWNHLWFVLYLFVYTLLIAGIGPLLKRLPARLMAPLASGWPVVVIPFAFLFIASNTLGVMFDQTHALFDDWYNHAVYFPAFLFGYAIAKHEAFFRTCERMRWPLLAIGVAAWAILVLDRYFGVPIGEALGPVRPYAGPFLRELQAWTMILALFGLARKHLRHDNAARRYLTDAIFPFYIIHQTTIVVAGYYLNKLGLPVGVEAAILITTTAASCWMAYEIARRVPVLRPLFGLKSDPKPAVARREPAAA